MTLTLPDRINSEPAPIAESAGTWHPVCAVDALEPTWGEAVLVAGRQVALVLVEPGELYAIDHRDPVTSAYVMARGIVGSRGDRATIASPLLKQVYDLRTGACLDDPGVRVETYRTRVVAGMVEVEVAA